MPYPGQKLKRFFLRVKAKAGTKKAAVAFARKVLCILHHLLINREMYQENGKVKSKPVKSDRTSSPVQMSEQDMIETLVKAGYLVRKVDARGCL
jgi:transposase